MIAIDDGTKIAQGVSKILLPSGATVTGFPDGSARINPTPITTAGDTVIGGSGGAMQRLAAGAINTVYTIDPVTGLPAWVLPRNITYEFTFAETAGDGIYTVTIPCPAGCTVLDVILRNSVLWNSGTSASIIAGDDDNATGYIAATNLKAAPSADTNGAGAGISTRLSLGATAGVYKGGGGKFCAVAKTLTAVLTKVGTGTAGRTRLLVEIAIPISAAAVKV